MWETPDGRDCKRLDGQYTVPANGRQPTGTATYNHVRSTATVSKTHLITVQYTITE